jgi:hypothetical protein
MFSYCLRVSVVVSLLLFTAFARGQIDVKSPSNRYAVRGAIIPTGDLAIVRVSDGKELGRILSPDDGINVEGVDVRWSPDEKIVVVLTKRRKLYDLDIFTRAESGMYVESEIETPELEAVFGVASDRMSGEHAALSAWTNGSMIVWSDCLMRTGSVEFEHYVFMYALVMDRGKLVVKDVKKVGVFFKQTV